MRSWLIAISYFVLCPAATRAAEPVPPTRDELMRIEAEVEAHELAARMVYRQKLRLGAYLAVVGAVAERMPFGDYYAFEGAGAFSAGATVGLRYALAGWLDVQARTGLVFPLHNARSYTEVADGETRGPAECAAAGLGSPSGGRAIDIDSAGGLAWTLDATLRARPAGSLVPFYVGVGPWLAVASATGSGNIRVYCPVDADPDNDREVDYRVSSSAATVFAGPIVEMGVDLGAEEQFEIGFRLSYGWALHAGGDSYGVLSDFEIVAGVMFL